jgi:hypothetical protein
MSQQPRAGAVTILQPRFGHVWLRDEADWYLEPAWVSERLFDVERFDGPIFDPACGMGRVVEAALRHGLSADGADLVDRSFNYPVADFLQTTGKLNNVVSNPPFDLFRQFATHALARASGKVAMLWLVRRLNAARWLGQTPLARIWLLTPRPSMPTGQHVLDGGKVGGGTQDFAWLVWGHGHRGAPELRWLHRDGDADLAERKQ